MEHICTYHHIYIHIYIYIYLHSLCFTSVRTCRWQPDLHWWWSYGWLLPILLGTKPMWSMQLVWMLWWTPFHIFHHRGQIFCMVSGMRNRPWERFGGVCSAVAEVETFFWMTVHGAACNNSWIEIYENPWFVKQHLMPPEVIAAIIASISYVFV